MKILNTCLAITFFISSLSVFAAHDRVTVMTYNVENLFDTEHDEGKEDFTFLPMFTKKQKLWDIVEPYCKAIPVKSWRDQCFELDYSEEALEQKFASLRDVLLEVQGAYGPGPDILILNEVENINVLKQWTENYLSDFGYYGFLLEGPDSRGIDQAVLSRLHPIAEEPHQLHPFPLKRGETSKERRGYLQVNLWMPDGMPMSLFALHLPSQGGPRELRESALEGLNKLKEKLPFGRVVLAGGDMNVTTEEEERYSPISRIIYPDWMRVELDCQACLGTYYYKSGREWSFLDRIFVARNTQPIGHKQWKIDRSSVRVVNTAPGQVDENGFPIRFDPMTPNGITGISDHLPLVFDLVK